MKNLVSTYTQGAAADFQDINPDLQVAFKKAFQVYTTQKGNNVVSISLGGMYKPTDTASDYDKIVMKKAKRIARATRSAISSAKMKSDVTISKAWEKKKGVYNKLRYRIDPYSRLSLAKNIAKKIGNPLDYNNYIQKSAVGLGKMRMRMNEIAANIAQGKGL